MQKEILQKTITKLKGNTYNYTSMSLFINLNEDIFEEKFLIDY